MNQGKYVFAQLTEFLTRRVFDSIVKKHGGNKYVRTLVPSFAHISKASLHDVNVLDIVPYEAGSFYVMDKAYIDFARLYAFHLQKDFFVTLGKENLSFKRMYSRAVDKAKGVKYDQLGKLEGHYSKKGYPQKLRRIKYFDSETGKEFVFLTNNTDLDATEIALLYKKRWEIELFFKWLKQHLRIKSFWGTTINTVKIQIYCAIISYCLVDVLGNKLKSKRRIYEILQILSISLLDKTSVKEILTEYDYKDVNELKNNQLKINGF